MELLIAAAMLAILFLGLGAHLRGGIAVWQRATNTIEALQRQRVALDRLDRDLTNAVVYDDLDTSYGPATGQLLSPEFVDPPMRWFTVTPATPEARSRVQVVTYTCRAINGVQGLWRTAQSIGELRARRDAVPELLLPECTDLTFQFAYRPAGQPADQPGPLEWRREWRQPQKELPRLIQVSIQLMAGAQIQHLAVIPAGVVKSVETPPAAP